MKFDPPLLKPKPFDSERHAMPRYAHWKKDGHRVRVTQATVTTTRGHDIFSQLRRCLPTEVMESIERFSDVTCDCELTCTHGVEAVKTHLAEGLPLSLYGLATYDLDPDNSLADVAIWFADQLCMSIPAWQETAGFSHEQLLEQARSYNGEGWVLKDGNLLNWLKLKVERTIDLVVTGTKDAESGKFFGLVGSLEMSASCGTVVCNCQGFDDLLRAQITEWDCDGMLNGRVAEIAYERVQTKGGLRHPRFKRWREDKGPLDCPLSQDPELERLLCGG